MSLRPSAPGQPDLLHQSDQVAEEPFLEDLSLVVPVGDGAELHVEAPVRRRDHPAVGRLHRALHGARRVRHRARVVPLAEEDPVRVVDQVVVREGLEELDRFQVVVVPSHRGRRRASLPRKTSIHA